MSPDWKKLAKDYKQTSGNYYRKTRLVKPTEKNEISKLFEKSHF